MLKKIKENWLVLLFLILLIIFILLRLFLFLKKDNSISLADKTNTNPIPTAIDITNQTETFEIDPDRDDILEQMPVRKFDILEFVPYKEDKFKIISLNDEKTKLTVEAKTDKESAKKAFDEFIQRYISEESKTFEVIWK